MEEIYCALDFIVINDICFASIQNTKYIEKITGAAIFV